MCLSAVCRSLRGWNVVWAPGFLFLLLFSLGCLCAGMSAAWEGSRKDLFQSQQQIPAGAWGQLPRGYGGHQRGLQEC